MKRIFFFAVIAALSLCSSMARASDDTKDAADLVRQAIANVNIFALPSFEMKAEVKVDNHGKPVEGSYTLLWYGPEQWREEVNFPGYSEIEVERNGIVSRKRTTDFLPLTIYQFRAALGYGSSPAFGSFVESQPRADETVKKIRDRKLNGIEVRCIELDSEKRSSRDVCVDKATNTIVRSDRFRDSELAPVGSKSFPRLLTYEDQGKTLAEVHITELTPTEKFSDSRFDVPPGAASRSGCMNPTPARLKTKVPPKYPEVDRQTRIQGTVSLYALAGADGILRNIKVLSGVSPTMNESSVTAVQQWRYEPAMCGNTPVETELVLTVNYSFSPG